MIYIYLSLGALFGAIVCLLGFILVMHARHEQLLMSMSIKSFERDQAWAMERQQLLDRIQAPSFDHLKQAEIRLVKAQKEEPPVKYELV